MCYDEKLLLQDKGIYIYIYYTTEIKLILNIISTTLMIKMGRIKGNKMIDMQLTNNKLINRAENILIDELKISHSQASELLSSTGSVRKSIEKNKLI